MDYVIIGLSYASLSAIEAIRRIDTTSRITCITKEAYKAYARPLISYVLCNRSKEDNIFLKDDNFYKENNVDLITSTTVEKILKDEHKIVLSNKSTLHYDKLLIATGSSPFIPPLTGLESVKEKYTFMTLDDMKSIKEACNKDSRLLILGAGLIGLKAAEGCYDRVKSISVVDLSSRLLSSILDEDASLIVQNELEEKGIKFHLNNSIKAFEGDKAYLQSGDVIEFDILIIAVGVRANTSLAKECGIEVDRGILINSRCQTSVDDIYAAGDVCQGDELTTKEKRVVAIIPNATLQGEAAGTNMAGGEKEFTKAVAMNAIGFFSSHIITAGSYIGDVEVIKDEDSYKKFFIKDNKLKGFILMKDSVDRAGIYTSLIRNEVNLSTIDWRVLKEKPMLAAFALKERKRMLSKEV